MQPLHRSLLPAFLLAALSVLPPAAFAEPDKIDSRDIVIFVTNAYSPVAGSTLTYLEPGVDRGPLEQVIRMWIADADRAQVGELDLVLRSATLKASLRAGLVRWTADGGLIKRNRASGDTVAFLDDALAKAHSIVADPHNKTAVDAAINANDGAPAVPDSRQTVDRARRVRESQRGDKNAFGSDRTAEQPGGGGNPGAEGGIPDRGPDPRTPPKTTGLIGGGKTQADIQTLTDELNAAERVRMGQSGVKLKSVGLPSPVEFQSLGSLEVAPAAGALDKAASLWASDSATITQDQNTIRANLKDATLPTVSAMNDGNTGAIAEFFRWLQSAKPDDMPTIDYAILPAGEVGHYELGLVSKGNIVLNHFIRDAEPRARSAVLVHELYHYWDKKVARNPYPNVSYGYIDPASKHIHEYDAYLATSQYWAMVKQDGDNSPLAKMLARIPEDAGGVRELVNGIAGKK